MARFKLEPGPIPLHHQVLRDLSAALDGHEWEPGDRMSSIDWAQSSMTNFSPLITRDFEQDSNATIVAVADA